MPRARLSLIAVLPFLCHAAWAGDIALVVLQRDWHTAIAIPLAAIPAPLVTAAHVSPGDDTLIIGFGARVWMGQPNRGLDDAISALTGGPGAMQIQSQYGLTDTGDTGVQTLTLEVSPENVAALAAFAWQAIAKRPDGQIAPYAEPQPGNRYYDSPTRYGMLHNCNSWTAEALRQAGVEVDPDGILRASQLMRAVKLAMGKPAAVR
jgi:hypothetical protein